MKKLLSTGFFICICAISMLAQKLPAFEDYEASRERTKIHPINFESSDEAKTYRAELTDALGSGVNFAGHFIVAAWDSGTDCIRAAIIDTRTGTVYFPNELRRISSGPGAVSAAGVEKLVFKSDSRLLILNGYNGSENNRKTAPYGIYYMEWTGTKFRLIRFEPKKS
jgi:hypothetical protein